ncbi:MAG TPA: PD-(D/E)XK nuclease family protein [Candidatus Paceibacterota bacterium]|nr:PD-(D/E)XK nuclease family protein [Candidatus Paceibacterota bacterium]
MQFKLSTSSISLMEDCPRCFWLDKHNVWKRPTGIFPSLPNGMDRILKKHFDNFRDKGKLPPELCATSHCSEMRLFGINEEEKELLRIWRDNRSGIEYEDDEGNRLMGAVDNVLVKDDKLIVLDYKTRGYPCKEDTHEHYQKQLDIYNFLLEKNGFNIEDYGFLLFYVPKEVLETGEVIFDTELIKMKINTEEAEKIFNRALKILNGKCPSEVCEWCKGV